MKYELRHVLEALGLQPVDTCPICGCQHGHHEEAAHKRRQQVLAGMRLSSCTK